MSRRKLQKAGECVYCGKVAPITDDHIPPRNLFSKPRPSNLIKVPSCKECHSENKTVSQDDEYFRLMVSLREDTAKHPEVEKILPVVFRSLARPQQAGFARSLLKRVKKVNLRTKGGLYLGSKQAYDVNLARLDNVARRIAKGLFYYENGRRIPDEYEVVAYSEDGLRDLTDDDKKHLQEKIMAPLITNAPKIIGDAVFSYRVSYTDADPNTSAWLLVFYERVAFLCLTLTKESMVKPNVQLP